MNVKAIKCYYVQLGNNMLFFKVTHTKEGGFMYSVSLDYLSICAFKSDNNSDIENEITKFCSKNFTIQTPNTFIDKIIDFIKPRKLNVKNCWFIEPRSKFVRYNKYRLEEYVKVNDRCEWRLLNPALVDIYEMPIAKATI